MNKKCELINTCGFFANYLAHFEVVKEKWVKLYCDSKVTSDLCERKKIRNQTGKPPEDRMAPTGKLW